MSILHRSSLTVSYGRLTLLWAVTLAAVIGVTEAQAQTACAPRDTLVAGLAQRYQEAAVAIGLSASGDILEVYATRDGKTWTIVKTNPAGLSCGFDAGEGWQAIEAPEAPDGDPA